MAVYISLIRGINVGGHKIVKMDQLRAALEKLGFQKVQTYIQSGNIVFQLPKRSASTISKKIEDAIGKEFGHSAAVITLTADELKAALEGNPFLKKKDIDITKLHVLFLSGRPDAADVKKLTAIPSRNDQFEWRDECIYLYLPNGAGESKLATAPFDRLLSVQATARNWNTVNRLHQMAQDCG